MRGLREFILVAGFLAIASGACDGGGTPSAEEVASGFVEAYGSFDTEAAGSYLAIDADLAQLEADGEDWRLGNQWLEAQGFQLLLGTCEERNPKPEGSWVRCPFDYHALRSDAR